MTLDEHVRRTGEPPPELRPLPLLLATRARETPDRVYLQEVDGGTSTFAEAEAAMRRWAGLLRSCGVRDGDRVGVMLPVGQLAHVLWFACGWLKAWEVPINTAFKGPMLAHVLRDAAVSVLVVAERHLADALAVLDQAPAVHTLVVPDLQGPTPACDRRVLGPDAIKRAPAAREQVPAISATDVATVMYTSGTTGPSKGCVLPWGEFAWGLDLFAPRKDGTDCHYCPFPANHLSGKCPVYNMAAFGGRVVLRERYSTEAFWPDVTRHGCTTTLLLGGLATFLYKQPARETDAHNPLETVFMAPVLPEYQEFEARFGVRTIACYGMTEIAWPFLWADAPLPNARTCGRRRDGWHVRIVDPDGRDVPVGDVGELWVRCDRPDSMMKEYLGRPEATAQAWASGWFHTGDAFRRDEQGLYYFVDRLKDALRRRGENISSFEVESYVKSHPAVLDCAVVAVPAESGEDEVKAVVVPKPGQAVDPAALLQFLLPQMPDFMIPRYVEVVEALPLTATSKVRKAELRAAGVTAGTWDRVAAGFHIKQPARIAT
jgi:crotonobetaine/carnitine-CoA ligase